MAGWAAWSGVAVSVIAVGVSLYALREAKLAKRTEERAAVDLLLNQHEVRRSFHDKWGYGERDLNGMRKAIAEWRQVCLQQINVLPKDSPLWFVIKDLAEQANNFARATDDIARKFMSSNGYIDVLYDSPEYRIVGDVTDQYQETQRLIARLTDLRKTQIPQ